MRFGQPLPLAALLLIGSASSLFPAEQWLKITSPNFELFTTAGSRKGREAVLYFEQVRELFDKIAKAKPGPRTPLRIVAFQSETEFNPYRANESAEAYYVGGPGRDYIVMKNISAEGYPMALHEYFHLIVNHSGLSLPVWLNEGMADIYSTLKPVGRKVQIGDILPGRLQQLQTTAWLDLETLLAVDQNSAFYNEKGKTGIFYSESWALAHMLYLSNKYWRKFPDFLARIRPGGSQAALFEQIYGKPLREIASDLEEYMRGTRFNAAAFDVKLGTSAEEPDIRPATDLESRLALAELLVFTHKNGEANAAYQSLARDNPKSAEVEQAWGRLAAITADHASMRRHYARAIELGSSDGQIYYDYAMLLRESGGKETEIAGALRKAVELKPDFQEAHYALGMYAMDLKQYSEAVVNLREVKKLDKVRAPAYFRALAYAYFELGKAEDARKEAASAVKYSTEAKDVEQSKRLLEYVSQSPAAPREEPRSLLRRRESGADSAPSDPTATGPGEQTVTVEGVLQQVDCLGKTARLRILTGGKQVAFLIDDSTSVFFKNGGPGTSQAFTCGPQKPINVALRHLPKPDPVNGTEGLIRAIEFR